MLGESDTVEDDVIYAHLLELAGGKIDLKSTEEDLSDSTSLMRTKSKYGGKSNTSKKNTSSNKKKYTNNRKRY